MAQIWKVILHHLQAHRWFVRPIQERHVLPHNLQKTDCQPNESLTLQRCLFPLFFCCFLQLDSTKEVAWQILYTPCFFVTYLCFAMIIIDEHLFKIPCNTWVGSHFFVSQRYFTKYADLLKILSLISSDKLTTFGSFEAQLQNLLP